MGFAEHEEVLKAGGGEWGMLVRTPEKLASRPGLLLCLAMDRRMTLDGDLYRIAPSVFLAAGHRVAAIDMPCHGDRADHHGRGLAGMAAAVAAGIDVYGQIREVARAAVDWAVSRQLVRAGEVLVTGTSRGGLAALHVMAGDERVAACAAVCPVTYLPALSEFAALAGNAIVERSNAEALLPALADRAVFLAMGIEDPRVDAGRCFRLHAQLAAGARGPKPVLFTAPGESHGASTFPGEAGHWAAAAFLLEQSAQRLRLASGGGSGTPVKPGAESGLEGRQRVTQSLKP